MTAYAYIATTEGLREAVTQLRAADVVSLDTEFARFSTYYPMVGLIQIYDGEHCYLIDPLAVDDLTPLVALLEDTAVLKVLHACSEDMEVFQYALGTIPSPVFDTQIASAALGVGFSVGYQSLVEHYLGITLPKDETRSDWLQRPLSDNQLEYAALDVIHLLQVYEKQAAELADSPKSSWIEAEAKDLGRDIPTITPVEEAYKRVKGLWQLDRKQLNVLRTLCAWRENRAREDNVPRNRVVDQKSLFAIAKGNLNSKQALQTAAKMTPRQVRKYSDEILFLQAEARLVPEKDCPPAVTRPDAPIDNKLMKKLKNVVEARAEDLNVAPELLTKRRHLEKLIRSEDDNGRYHLPAELSGWRESAVGSALLSALTE